MIDMHPDCDADFGVKCVVDSDNVDFGGCGSVDLRGEVDFRGEVKLRGEAGSGDRYAPR